MFNHQQQTRPLILYFSTTIQSTSNKYKHTKTQTSLHLTQVNSSSWQQVAIDHIFSNDWKQTENQSTNHFVLDHSLFICSTNLIWFFKFNYIFYSFGLSMYRSFFRNKKKAKYFFLKRRKVVDENYSVLWVIPGHLEARKLLLRSFINCVFSLFPKFRSI